MKAGLIVGLVMLKRGWMSRCMPLIVKDLMPDVVFGAVRANLMVFSAALSMARVLDPEPALSAAATSLWALCRKINLLVIPFAIRRRVGRFHR